MPCTTILVGKKASYDGSTMIARTDDGFFDEKKIIVVNPKDQPRKYKSVISHLEIELPDNPLRYTSCPSVDPKNGVWPATGINELNVGMSATETITSNPLVLGADPFVKYQKAKSKKEKDIPGGIGEEDLCVLVLPYIKSAREGVIRLGSLLEKYGTYESNGIAFNDESEVWWLESIGGHHWIAKRVPDDKYVIMPNQFGLDNFDFDDAFGAQKDNMCSSDLKEFIEKYHLDSNNDGKFNPRVVFGSHDDSDHVYNTPRAWFMARYFNPTTYKWDGENADFTPESDNIPWSLVPERKIRVEEVKYILSSYYQGTPYNPYQKADNPKKGIYRPIGINRTGVCGILQIRPYAFSEAKAIEWICFGPLAFNTVIPLYTNVLKMPEYVASTKMTVDTNTFYWSSRLIAALADSVYGTSIQVIERYQKNVPALGHAIINEYDELIKNSKDVQKTLAEANEKVCKMAREETDKTLFQVLRDSSVHMKDGYSRADN
ncbi:MAG: C69 family dipeptidase [Acholeplasmatales bacterium]|nr:C69 family dipeptidase [Acholeplasmatales bacterium]